MDGISLFRRLGVGAKFDFKRFHSDAEKLKLIEVKKPETPKCVVATPDEKPKVKEIKDKENKLNDSDSNEDDIEILPNLQLKLPDKGKKKDKSAKKVANLQKELLRHIRNKNKIHVHGQDVANPVTSFNQLKEEFNLHPRILENIQKSNYTSPTPIQMQAIPVMMQRREILACAPTGSGKTAAFILPLLHHLQEPRNAGVRAVVLAPTRELASQIYQDFQRLSEGRGFRIQYIHKANLKKFGSKAFKKIDILVTTPQRLIFLLSQESAILTLSTVEWLVIDESDKLFEDGKTGFRDQLGTIYKACDSPNIRRAMFSATFAYDVEQWCKLNLDNVVQVYIGGKNMATTTIDQQLLFAGTEIGKLFAMREIIQKGIEPPVLIFVQSKERAKELFQELIFDGINVDVIHAGRTQIQRENVVKSFREGKIWVLICTELMGRGIDFKGVNLVINYDFPNSAISYIHRIGRTGRAGRPGKAITFFVEDDVHYLRSIASVMKEAGCPVPEYMLNLKRPDKKERRKMAQTNPKRRRISTTPYEDIKAAKKQKMSKKRKHGKISKTQLKKSRPFPGKRPRKSKVENPE